MDKQTADDIVSAAHTANKWGDSFVDIINFNKYLSIAPQMYETGSLQLFSLIDKVSVQSFCEIIFANW